MTTYSSAEQPQPLPLVNVKCDLGGAGLHRSLTTEVHLTTPETYHPCQDTPFLLLKNITRDMYVDLDQVESNSRLRAHNDCYDATMHSCNVLWHYMYFPVICTVDLSSNGVWWTTGAHWI